MVDCFVSVAAALQNQLSGIAPPSISKPSLGGTTPAIASPQPTAAQVPSTLSNLIAVTEQLNNIPSTTTNNTIKQQTQSVNAAGQIPGVGSMTSQQPIIPSAATITAAQLEATVKAAASVAASNGTSRGASPKLPAASTPPNLNSATVDSTTAVVNPAQNGNGEA